MKAIKLAGLVGMMLASTVMASNVIFTPNSSQAGAMVNPGDPIDWTVKVDVTGGDNQGLAAYVADLEVTGPGPVGTLGPADFAFYFDNAGRASLIYGTPTSVDDTGNNGGAGMNGVSNTGNTATPGKIVGFGAGYGPWSSPYNTGTKKGSQVWGVGLADRKAVLLNDAGGEYILHNGTFSAPATPGVYTVTVIPGRPNVLKAGLDFNLVQAGEYVSQADQWDGGSFTFTVIPEPATMLLLVSGVGLALRRRRA